MHTTVITIKRSSMMKKNIINVLFLTLLPSSFLYSSEEPEVNAVNQLRSLSIFSPRSQDINAARDVVGWHPFIHRYDIKKNYTALAFTPQYNQSLRPKNIS